MTVQTPPQTDGRKPMQLRLIVAIIILIVGFFCVIVVYRSEGPPAAALGSIITAILAIFTFIGHINTIVEFVNFLLGRKGTPTGATGGVVNNNTFHFSLPFIDPSLVYENSKMIEAIYAELLKEDINALVLTGSSGVGKSTVAALVYQYVKKRADKDKHFNAEPLWLRVDEGTTISDLTSRVMTRLDKIIPSFGRLLPQNQVQSLINTLSTISKEESRIVFVDQFEDLLKKRELSQGDVGVDALLDMLNRQVFSNPNCRVVFTGENTLAEIEGYEPLRIKEYPLRGFSNADSLEFLGQLGVHKEEYEGLENAISNYHGHAFSLTLLASILRHDEGLALPEFIQDPKYARGSPSEHLLEYIYTEQLNAEQQQLLLAFSVFRKPVELAVAEAALLPSNKASYNALKELLDRCLLLNRGRERYQLHALVANFAHRHFTAKRSTDDPTNLIATHARVASFYEKRVALNSAKSTSMGRGISALPSLVEAAWHYCLADQWPEAYALMEREKLFSKLFDSGTASALLELLELYTLLLPLEKWHLRDPRYPSDRQRAMINSELGQIYVALEMHEKAIPYFALALDLFEEIRDIRGKVSTLSNLGEVYRFLGEEKLFWIEIEKTQDLLHYPLLDEGTPLYARKSYQHRGMSTDVGIHFQKARDYFQEAQREDEGDSQPVTGQIYYNLGLIYSRLNEQEEAKNYMEKALSVYRGLRAVLEEARTLYSLGRILIAQKDWSVAREALNQALSLQREIGDRKGEGTTLDRLGRFYDHIDEQQKAWHYYKQALQIEIEVGDRRGYAITLHNIGALYHKQDLPKEMLEEMLALLQHAQKIFEQIHHPIRERAQRKLGMLLKRLGEKAFADLQKDVDSKTHQIIERAKGPLSMKVPEFSALSFPFPGSQRVVPTQDQAGSSNPPQDASKPPVSDAQQDASEQTSSDAQQDVSPV